MNSFSKTDGIDISNGVMFNAYPDSCGGSLKDFVNLFKTKEFKDVFSFLTNPEIEETGQKDGLIQNPVLERFPSYSDHLDLLMLHTYD